MEVLIYVEKDEKQDKLQKKCRENKLRWIDMKNKTFQAENIYLGWQPWSNMTIMLWYGMIMVIHTRHGMIKVKSCHGHHET